MKHSLDRILEAKDELASHSEPLPGFLAKFGKPLETIRTWAESVTDFCQQVHQHSQSFEQTIQNLEQQVEELEQRTTKLEQEVINQLRDFAEANQNV